MSHKEPPFRLIVDARHLSDTDDNTARALAADLGVFITEWCDRHSTSAGSLLHALALVPFALQYALRCDLEGRKAAGAPELPGVRVEALPDDA